jgi:uncharacterized membrane-anchored protein YjiN (DUF445 family)
MAAGRFAAPGKDAEKHRAGSPSSTTVGGLSAEGHAMSLEDPTLPPPAASGAVAPDRADAVRRLRLRKNRLLATGLLAAMGAVFAATHMVLEPGFLTRLIQAGAEAGMVGGIADWFAVTALFRHPLGLPIPHTAIIPNNKERIGRTLGRFVESNFLTPEVLFGKLRQLQVGRRIAEWLAAPATAGLIAHSITAALPHVIHSLRSRDLHRFVRRAFGEEVSHLDVVPAIAHGIRLLTASGEADVLFDRGIAAAIRWLTDNRGQLDTLISQRSRWWIPKAIDRRIGAAIVDGAIELLTGLHESGGDARAQFRATLSAMVDSLIESPEERRRINEAARRLLGHPDTRAWLAATWKELGDAAAADLAQPQSRLSAALEKPISLVAKALATDEVMQRHIDDAVERIAHSLINWRTEIGSFIAEVVRNWDTRTLVERLELVVGSDLQYIRMNGTVVGACAGCAIFVATHALS